MSRKRTRREREQLAQRREKKLRRKEAKRKKLELALESAQMLLESEGASRPDHYPISLRRPALSIGASVATSMARLAHSERVVRQSDRVDAIAYAIQNQSKKAGTP